MTRGGGVAEQSGEILLAIETTGDVCSFALLRDGRLQAEYLFRHELHLSEKLPTILEWLYTEIGARLEQTAAFAVDIGPGSFTGTRIGVMTCKAFADVFDRAIYGVGSLEAFAAEYLGLPGMAIVPLLPCRPNVVYAAIYDVSGALPQPILEPAAFSCDELIQRLQERSVHSFLFCGPASETYRQQIEGAVGERAAFAAAWLECPRASTLGMLAWRRRAKGEKGESALSLIPTYIAPPPISTPKQSSGLAG